MKKDYIFTPGPTPVPLEVGLAQVRMVHHRSADFARMLASVLDGLRYVFQTENDVLMFTSSGTGVMEGAVSNCFSPGDKVAVFNGGKFGMRFVEISRFYGLEVLNLSYDWSESADLRVLEKTVEENPDLSGVMITHSETSTGVVNDIETFGRVVAETDALFIVDTISGLGGLEFRTDAWSVDVAVSGSQKALMTPPGLAFAAVSDKAWAAVEKSTLPRYYFDFKAARKSLSKKTPETPYTPAITLVQGLDKAIEMIRAEGLDAIQARHELFGKATQAAVEALGLEFYAKDRSRSFIATSVVSPGGIDSGDIVRMLRNEFGVFIAGGQGKLKGKIFRLGHVGYFDPFDITTQIAALELGLSRLGVEVKIGAGVTAALKVLNEGLAG